MTICTRRRAYLELLGALLFYVALVGLACLAESF